MGVRVVELHVADPAVSATSSRAATGPGFRVSWQEFGLGATSSRRRARPTSARPRPGPNLNYQSMTPPLQFPPLCAAAAQCGNSLAGSYFLAIWGAARRRWSSRSSPLDVRAARATRSWAPIATAAAQRVAGPVHPAGIEAAKVESVVTQTGALGDPFGRACAPSGGLTASVPCGSSSGTPVAARAWPSSRARRRPGPAERPLHVPLAQGVRATFRWRNDKHMRRWSVQRARVVRTLNNSSRVEVRDLSGRLTSARRTSWPAG